jgi:hypothetical protein
LAVSVKFVVAGLADTDEITQEFCSPSRIVFVMDIQDRIDLWAVEVGAEIPVTTFHEFTSLLPQNTSSIGIIVPVIRFVKFVLKRLEVRTIIAKFAGKASVWTVDVLQIHAR